MIFVKMRTNYYLTFDEIKIKYPNVYPFSICKNYNRYPMTFVKGSLCEMKTSDKFLY